MTVTFRASTPDSLEAVLAFSTSDPVSWIGPDRHRQESATRNHRPEWSFLAERDARAGGPAAGLVQTTERVSVVWEPGTGLQSVGRAESDLTFRTGDDDDAEFTDPSARVTVGSLDAHTRATVAELGAHGSAIDDLEFSRSLPGRRQDWRIAEYPDGLVVGFVLATRTAYDAAVSYIGVLPQHRGKGVVGGLLTEALRIHAEAGEPRVVATTDTDNTPMRLAFARAGFTVTKRRLVFAA